MASRGVQAFDTWAEQRDALRGQLARLVGGAADDFALVPNTMYGLATVALSFPWRRGDRLVLFEGEYPTNVSVWQRAAERFDLTIDFIPVEDFGSASAPDLSRLQLALSRGARLCAVSAVQFQTGLRMPLAEIARACHDNGAELCVDGVQGCGAVPIHVSEMGVDYLACGAHKWLMGMDGAGFLYVEPGCMSRLRPAIAGAMSHVDGIELLSGDPGQLRYDRPLRGDARGFEGGMVSSAGFAALEAAVELLLSLGVGEIYRHVSSYLDALETGLSSRGFQSLRTADDARRSCILSLRPPEGVATGELVQALADRGVVCSSPDGLVRISPHWPNSHEEVPLVLEAVDASLAELSSGGR